MQGMKRILFFLALFIGVSTLSATASFAINPCTPRPGCSCDFLNAAENHANSVRVRDKAYHRQTIKQADNTAGMTCFDHALTLSSQLGQIFSDTGPGFAIPTANLEAWDPSGVIPNEVYDRSAGVGNNPRTGQSKHLGTNYGVVFGGEMQQHATNFGDSLSAWLGATLLSYMNSFMGMLQGAIATYILGPIATISGWIDNLATWVQNIQSFLDLLGGALPSAVVAIVTSIQAIWSNISSIILSAVNTLMSTIQTWLNNIANAIQSVLGSLLGQFNIPGSGECSRIQRLWNGGVQALGGPVNLGSIISSFIPPSINSIMGAIGLFRAIEGGGIEQGNPYFDFRGLVSGALQDAFGGGIPMGSSPDLADEIANTLNQPILNAALADITGAGLLSTRKPPGAGVIWPDFAPSVFVTTPPATATIGAQLTNIINDM